MIENVELLEGRWYHMHLQDEHKKLCILPTERMYAFCMVFHVFL